VRSTLLRLIVLGNHTTAVLLRLMQRKRIEQIHKSDYPASGGDGNSPTQQPKSES